MTTTFTHQLADLIKQRMHQGEVKLSGGGTTDVYLDIPHVLSDSQGLLTFVEAFDSHLTNHGFFEDADITAIGGPEKGADAISIACATDMATLGVPMRWFSIRSKVKDHGMGKLIVGAELTEDDRVLLVDDVVNTGRSLLAAYDSVVATGAQVAAVVPLVDRSGAVEGAFRMKGVPYLPVLTYADLGLDPIGS